MQRAAVAAAALILAGLAGQAVPAAPSAAAQAVPGRELPPGFPAGPLTLPGPAWTASTAPLPAGAGGNPLTHLYDVACPPVSAPTAAPAPACVAVGAYADSAGATQLVLLTWHGPAWTGSRAPLPAGAASKPDSGLPGPTVASLACPSATACVAVGYYTDASGSVQGLLLTRRGATWTASRAPLPAGSAASANASLSGVACRSAVSCVAAGSYIDSSGRPQGLLLTQRGSSWRAAKAPLPAGAAARPEAYVWSVACPPSATCVAAGDYTSPSGSYQGLLLTQHGSSWTASAAPLPAGAAASSHVGIGQVTCPSATTCVATGEYAGRASSAGDGSGLLLTGRGPSWRAATAPLPAGAATSPGVGLGSMSCPAVAACAATGVYIDSSGNYQGLLLTGHGSSWLASTAPLPAGAATSPYPELRVACPSGLGCVAAGYYTDSSGSTQALLLTGHGSSWLASTAPLPAGAATSPHAYLSGVACSSAASCVAAGGYTDSSGHQQGLLLTGPG